MIYFILLYLFIIVLQLWVNIPFNLDSYTRKNRQVLIHVLLLGMINSNEGMAFGNNKTHLKHKHHKNKPFSLLPSLKPQNTKGIGLLIQQ